MQDCISSDNNVNVYDTTGSTSDPEPALDLQPQPRIITRLQAMYSKCGYLYIVRSDDWKDPLTLKTGKTVDLYQRLQNYNGDNEGELTVRHFWICRDVESVEDHCKAAIGRYLYHPRKLEWVRMPLSDLKTLIGSLVEIDRRLTAHLGWPIYRLRSHDCRERKCFAPTEVAAAVDSSVSQGYFPSYLAKMAAYRKKYESVHMHRHVATTLTNSTSVDQASSTKETEWHRGPSSLQFLSLEEEDKSEDSESEEDDDDGGDENNNRAKVTVMPPADAKAKSKSKPQQSTRNRDKTTAKELRYVSNVITQSHCRLKPNRGVYLDVKTSSWQAELGPIKKFQKTFPEAKFVDQGPTAARQAAFEWYLTRMARLASLADDEDDKVENEGDGKEKEAEELEEARVKKPQAGSNKKKEIQQQQRDVAPMDE